MTLIIETVNRIPTHCGVAYHSVNLLARGHVIRVWILEIYQENQPRPIKMLYKWAHDIGVDTNVLKNERYALILNGNNCNRWREQTTGICLCWVYDVCFILCVDNDVKFNQLLIQEVLKIQWDIWVLLHPSELLYYKFIYQCNCSN